MTFILWLFMVLIPLCLGKGVLCLLYGNQPTQDISPADEILTGNIVVIGLAEAAHLAGCILGRSFSDCVILFQILVGVFLFAAVAVWLLHGRRVKEDPRLVRKVRQEQTRKALQTGSTGMQLMLYVIFGILVIVQLIMVVMAQNISLDGDMTRETVNSFLASDAIYQVNPMTGQAYTLGIPLRLKILCLPTLYAMLCQIFHLHADVVVLRVVPACVLLSSYLSYGTVAKRLFPKEKYGRIVFMVLAALLFSMWDYMPVLEGFGVLHGGFRGSFIRVAVLLPYTFGLMLRRKYKLVVLCILAEACIVWTLYGLGACAAVAAGMLFLAFARDWYTRRAGRKEDALC